MLSGPLFQFLKSGVVQPWTHVIAPMLVVTLESVTWAVKLNAPTEVGIPEISPPEPSESPAGRVPLEIAHL
jgi:hypothetical protein